MKHSMNDMDVLVYHGCHVLVVLDFGNLDWDLKFVDFGVTFADHGLLIKIKLIYIDVDFN